MAQDIAAPEIQEKDRQEAADFISGIQSKTNSDYEFEAQKIVENAEEVKKKTAKTHAKDVREVAENVYLIKIAYNEFDNEIWKGYVRLSTIKNKSEFFISMLNTITEYENKNK